MYKSISISFLLIFIFYAVQAQDRNDKNHDSSIIRQDEPTDSVFEVHDYPNTDHAEVTDTTLFFNSLTISPDSIQSWKNAKAFAYAKYLDSLLKVSQDKERVSRPVSSGPGWLDGFLSDSVTKLFFWILAGIFIIFILYRLFLVKGIFSKDLKSDATDTPAVSEEKFTVESDFDALIRQAISLANYRLAIRYQYLKSLHKLAGKNFIELAADKTNYQYVKEINDSKFRNDFAALTLSYEYVWYGEFAVEEKGYRNMETGFLTFNQKL